jgi:signal transduction histidine kinase
LGAELTVASTPGSGATFKLSLPLTRVDKRSAATSSR